MCLLYFPNFYYDKYVNIKIKIQCTTFTLLFNSAGQTTILEIPALWIKSIFIASFVKY